ncbi:GON4L, partial [Cervus elaphus hippelaphus]
FQDEMGFSNMEDDGPEEEERVAEPRPNFNTPQALRFEEPLANLLNEQHRTVKELLEQLKMKKSSAKQQQEVERVNKPQREKVHQTLILDPAQRKRLQQQMQQHVQLLTQIHLLTSSNPNLSSEASTTRIFLFNPKFQTLFQPCNLMGAMKLIEDFSTHVSVDWSPRKTVKKTACKLPCLPKQVAWILATSKVFMYPELLPVCSLKAKNPQDKIFFTKAEDNLLALGLKHFEGTEFPKPLISKYLLTCKTAHQLTVRIKNLNMNRAPDNIIKPAPLIHPAPVFFTVPATTVKVVSLGSGCNMVQPVGAAVARSPQTIPITTLLVNPTAFPCALNQPLVASSIPPLIVSGPSVNLSVPSTPEDKAPVNVDTGCPLAEGKNAFPGLEPKVEPREPSPVCAAVFPKEEHSPGPPATDRACQEQLSESSACGWTTVKTEEGRQAPEPLPQGFRESLHTCPEDLEEIVKTEPKDPGQDTFGGSLEQDSHDEIKEEHSVELDTGFPSGESSGPREGKKQTGLQQEERSQAAQTLSASQEPPGEGNSGDVSKGSPRDASFSTDPEMVLSSPLGKPEDLSSVDGQSVGTPAGPETAGEKDGPEEEEEEDFDDLTQDEEDEMSSASEESVLSVPELQ